MFDRQISAAVSFGHGAILDLQLVEKLRDRLMGKSLDRHWEPKRRTTIHLLHRTTPIH